MTNLYDDLATQFSESRNYLQPGWSHLKQLQLPARLRVLDLGCGNGRFYKFLQTQFPNTEIEYTGIDSSVQLLDIATKSFGNDHAKFQSGDLLDLPSLDKLLANTEFDLVVVYAVMHHIPHFTKRLELMKLAGSKLAASGYLHISFWQFAEYDRYRSRIGFAPELVGMQKSEMEANDYIMDWQRGGAAYRFCHWANEAEITKFSTALMQQAIHLQDRYRADGKEGDQNWYWLWRKVN